MNSKERKELRYQRRKLKRKLKHLKLLKEYGSFDYIITLSSLLSSYRLSKKSVSWKSSVQRYGMNLLRNIYKSHRDLLSGKDVRKGFVEFYMRERGKVRHIKSIHISERIIQKSLCRNALLPILSRNLIYDNCASQKNKGITFAINRLKTHLHRYYRKHGNNGYILQLDYKNYFGSINHSHVEKLLRENLSDEKTIDLAMSFISSFGDVSLGLGSEISQSIAIAYPNKVDHFIKEKLRIKGFGRYMDDFYLIHPDKEYLKYCLVKISEIAKTLDLTINTKKTRIVKLSRGFTFLKTQFFLTSSGKINTKVYRYSITRQRRKLKKWHQFFLQGLMTKEQIEQSYNSWLGYISHKNSYHTKCNMNKLYNSLFKEDK